ncbi:hypothetical protein ABH926_001431 [Catenulispora sp. GP43]|uniref:DUF4097 family beta strand repeat-containing protein n=1 Tax=Catenulispora sp. GP43 TaxID=3156263 RepID=UPI0035191ED0
MPPFRRRSPQAVTRTSPGPARLLGAAAIASAAVLAASACQSSAKDAIDESGSMQQMTADASVSGHVTAVSIQDARHGSVRVRPGGDSGVTIHRTVYYHDSTKPTPGQSLSDGTLTFSNGCSDCYIDYDLTVPASATISAGNSSGQIDVAGVASVDISTDSGPVTIDKVPGTVKVDSSSGTITGTSLGAGAATVHSSSGGIDLAFAQQPASVTTQSSSGGATLALPGGPYAVTVHTSSGGRTVSVPTGSGPAISVTTSSGAVVVKPS